jgi:25S rRNA (uracil2634-N3)-methyltransferase
MCACVSVTHHNFYLTVLSCGSVSPQHIIIVMVKHKQGVLEKLASAQARLNKKKKAEDAAARQQAKKSTAKGQTPRRSTIPFGASDRILLIGEGNFSFAVALLQPLAPLEHLPAANITATALDTEKECHAKYPDAAENVRVLRETGAQVLFGVDATKLEKTSALKGKVFDRIVWNFPHAGEYVPMTCIVTS